MSDAESTTAADPQALLHADAKAACDAALLIARPDSKTLYGALAEGQTAAADAIAERVVNAARILGGGPTPELTDLCLQMNRAPPRIVYVDANKK